MNWIIVTHWAGEEYAWQGPWGWMLAGAGNGAWASAAGYRDRAAAQAEIDKRLKRHSADTLWQNAKPTHRRRP